MLQNAGELGKDIPWVKARQRIGMVFQSYELFAHLSVIDNILLGPLKVQKRDRAKAEKQADELLKTRRFYMTEKNAIHVNYPVAKTANCHCSFTLHEP